MHRTIYIAMLMIAGALAANAQSGRKVEPLPTPEPKAVKPPYSESTPTPRRPRLPTARKDEPIKPRVITTDQKPESVGDDDVLKVETDLITIPVSVYDRNGIYIAGLGKDDFKIFEDGEEQDIEYLATTDKPFTVVLLLDTSLSAAYKIEEIQDAARAFVDLLKPEDSVIVIEFDGNTHVLTEVTSDRERIYKAINKADWGFGTSIYDAVNFTFRKRLSKITGRKAIVLFTDGVDTTSRKATYDSTLDMAEEEDALIFPIYYNTFGQGQRRIPGVNINVVGTRAIDYALGKKYIEELADYTGGRVFRPEVTPGGLRRAFEGIAEELRRQYNIGYIPKAAGTPGQRKQIKVRVNRPNLVVRARDSYIVGSSIPDDGTNEPGN